MISDTTQDAPAIPATDQAASPAADRTDTEAPSSWRAPDTAMVRDMPVPSSSEMRTADIARTSTASRGARVERRSLVDGDDAQRLWELYEGCLGQIDDLSALNHVESHERVIRLFANQAVTKIVAYDEDDDPIGLGLVTNALEIVEDTTPAFFRARFPEHADGRIFYGMAILIAASRRGMSVFSKVYIDMWQFVAEHAGVLVFDCCKFNRDAFDVDSLVERIAAQFPGSTLQVIDQQTFWAAELPNPIS